MDVVLRTITGSDKPIMKKILYGLLLLCAAIFLIACASSQEAPPTPALVSNPVLPVTATPQFTCKVIEQCPRRCQMADTGAPHHRSGLLIGPTDAPVTILEYCDFQSQGCLAVAQTIAELMRHYTGGIRFVFPPHAADGCPGQIRRRNPRCIRCRRTRQVLGNVRPAFCE